jgi:hypothetical protein
MALCIAIHHGVVKTKYSLQTFCLHLGHQSFSLSHVTCLAVGIDDVMVEYCIGGPSLVLCSLEPMLCSSINIGKKKEEKSMSQKASTAVFFQRHAGIYGQVMT